METALAVQLLTREKVREWPISAGRGKNGSVDTPICEKILIAIQRGEMVPEALMEVCAHIEARSEYDENIIYWVSQRRDMTPALWKELSQRARKGSITKNVAAEMAKTLF